MKQTLFSAICATMLISASVGAQGLFDGYVGTRDGSGTVRHGTDRDPVREVHVNLSNRGRAELVFSGSEGATRIHGSWSWRSRDAADIRVDRAFNSTASGRVTVNFTGRQLATIRGNGSARNRGFDIDFRVYGRDQDGDGDRDERVGTYSTTGVGRLRLAGNDRVSKVTIRLQRNRRFELEADGERDFRLRGTYSTRSNGDTDLRVTEGFGTTVTSGSGWATLRGEEIVRMHIVGRIGARTYELSFADEWVVDRDNDSRFNSLRATERGSGRLRSGNRDDRVSQVRVNLDTDGDATIWVDGERDTSFTGRWRGNRSNTVDLTITGGLGNENARGDGKITLDGSNGFRVINLNGWTMRGRDRWSLHFESTGRGGGQWDDRDNSDLRQAAGTYRYEDAWRARGERYVMRYRLTLHRDGRAELGINADNDVIADRQTIDEHGELLRYLDRQGEAIQYGTWDADGSRITVNLDRIRTGLPPDDNLRKTLRGRYGNGTVDFDDFDRNFYGRTVGFGFRRD